jgi:hypothetical protein
MKKGAVYAQYSPEEKAGILKRHFVEKNRFLRFAKNTGFSRMFSENGKSCFLKKGS